MVPSTPLTPSESAFLRYCLPYGGNLPFLTLVAPDAAPAAFIATMARRHGSAESLEAIGPRGLDFPALRTWLGARQRSRQSVAVVATSAALKVLLDRLEKIDLRFRLPAGSVVVEIEESFIGDGRAETQARLTTRLGLTAGQRVRAYLPPGLEAPAFTAVLAGGAEDVFVAPADTELVVVEPSSLKPLPAGEVGRVAVVVGDGEPRPTHDLGEQTAGGVRLTGSLA